MNFKGIKNQVLILIMIAIALFYYYNSHYLTNEITESTSDHPSTSTKITTSDDIIKQIPDYFNVDQSLRISNKTEVERLKTALNATLQSTVPDIKKLDDIIMQIMSSDKLSRQDRINILWSIANTTEYSNDIRGRYIFDNLFHLKPIELTDSLIQAYSIITDKNNKLSIANILQNSISILDKMKQTKEQQLFINNQSIKIQDFLYQQAINEQDSDVQAVLLNLYISISDQEKLTPILSSLLYDQFPNIQKEQAGKMSASIFLKDVSIQENMFPLLLSSKSDFNNGFYNELIMILSDKENQQKISPSIIETMKTYIQTDANKFYYSDGSLDTFKYTKWIEANAKLDSLQFGKSISDILYSKVYSSNIDTLQKALIIGNMTNKEIIHIQQDTRFSTLLDNLKAEYLNKQRTESERFEISAAINSLTYQ